MATAEGIVRSALQWLALAAKQKVKPLIPSATLADALEISNIAARSSRTISAALAGRRISEIRLTIPHYWAVYIHDGRPAFGPRRATFLVWFTDPDDDPRLAGGFPVRYSDVKRLTKEQFHEGLRINAQRRAVGATLYMHIARSRRGDPPRRFFSEGLAGFVDGVPISLMVSNDLRQFVLARVKSRRDVVRGVL